MFGEKAQDFLMKITKRNDIVLALFLVTIAFIMILPLPTLLIDLLLGINFTGAILLLMVAVYIPTPLAFSAFPSVLLLTTLFRLALSIATTRLILLQADAGQIVYTFGEFVVAGNIVIGFVIFLIITVVQFIVITKGSERVAEVSARFSLDAMPGKQMSIDSDMRAGVITMDEARYRRTRLEKESQLYGSMDGAMKFVKGDAIAGLVIIFVNILGGMSVGVMQQGMAVGEAADIYSILTIGDGLVSQIPALFISITAGIIVTRVTVDDTSNLGQDIGNQMMAQPKALIIAAAVVFVMGIIPGFPTVVFWFLGVVMLGVGIAMLERSKSRRFVETGSVAVMGTDLGEDEKLKALGGSADSVTALENAPVLLELSEAARGHVDPQQLHSELQAIRRSTLNDMGVPVPSISMKVVDSFRDDVYQISIQGVPVANGSLGVNKVFVRQNHQMLNELNIPYEQGQNFLPGLPTVWVESAHKERLSGQNVGVMDPVEIIMYHLKYVIQNNISEFIGVQEVHQLFHKLEKAGYTDLLKETQQFITVPKITDVLRNLVSENISIRDLRKILGVLVQKAETEKDTDMLTEHVRSGLKYQISHAFSNGTNVLPVYLMDPETEMTITQSVRQTPSGVHLALESDVSEKFVQSIRDNETSARQMNNLTARPVLLTSTELRRFLSSHVRTALGNLPVLAFQELTPAVRLQPLGKIQLNT